MAGSGNDITSTQTSAPSSPMVGSTLDKLLGQLNTSIDAGPTKPFASPLYAGTGKTTGQGWTSALTAANNPLFKSGITGAYQNNNNIISSGGLTRPQQDNINATTQVRDRLGALSDSYRKPGILEQTLGGTARGQYLDGANPYFEKNLSTALDQAGAGVNSAIGSSGRFGSGAHVDRLAMTLGNLSNSARGQQYETERDRQVQAAQGIGAERQTGIGNQLNALLGKQGAAAQGFGMQEQGVTNAAAAGNNLASLFQSSLLPSATLGAVGGQQDADKQAALLANAQLHNSNNSNFLDWLSKNSSIFGGTAPYGGTTQTSTTPSTPWWQTAFGTGTALAGAFL